MVVIKVNGMKNEAAPEEEDVFEARKDAAGQRLEHLEDILNSFQPTTKDADQSKLSLIDYIVEGLDTIVSGVETRMGLKKGA